MTAERMTAAERCAANTRRAIDVHSLEASEVVVGVDVLELVSSAMYLDPMTVYREYTQNAADAIDEARRTGVLRADERGRVDIEVDPTTRSILIRDNGSGIAWPSFVKRLTALGASGKRGAGARGFRGVGRLAGLGYAQELIFRSRAMGEKLVSELRWDSRQLKTAFRASGVEGGVADLIRSVVTASRADAADYPEHFFEVELKGVLRLRSDKLMTPSAIAEYLGQVAPVPFSPEFRFGANISAALRAVLDLGELEVRISGMQEPVYRPHRNTFSIDDKRSAVFDSLEFVEVPGIDGGVAGIAWILHHDYEGAVPTAALIKGLRLRSGNIQIGDHALLDELFPEPRFNVWSVGEVHVVDKRIVPNGRRDHFEQNAHLHNLVNHLTPTARDIARRCRTSSVRRKWLREFEMHRQGVVQDLEMIAQGGIGATKRKNLALAAEQALLQMEKIAAKDLLVEDEPDNLKAIARKLRVKLGRVMHDKTTLDSPLARLPPKKREMYEHFFELVYQCAANRIAAKALVDRILRKLG